MYNHKEKKLLKEEKNKMKEYEVIIDLGSKTLFVKANNKEDAEQQALKLFESLPDVDKIDEYWVGECDVVEDD
jgi:uncharacterized protein YjaG (DUF416 family)